MSERSIRRAHQRQVERKATPGRRKAQLGTIAGSVLGGAVLFAPAADAATFNVTNLNDAGEGSLRDAIDDANADAIADQITFQAGLSGTINLSTGHIEISEPVSVQGPGSDVITVSGADAQRIFYVDPNTDGAAVSISGLTIADGDPGGQDGGALYAHDANLTIASVAFTGSLAGGSGGALFAANSAVTITDSVLSGNEATDQGGGIFFEDTDLTVTGSTISGNRGDEGGGLYGAEDDLATPNRLVMESTVVSDNYSADDGGGIGLEEPSATIRNSTISGNRSADYGGGLIINPVGPSVIEHTTISGNSADGAGGGIYFDSPNEMTIANTTVSGNSSGTHGGGIATCNCVGPDDRLVVRNSTVVGNEAVDSAGGIYRYEHDVTVASTIVAGNTAPDGDLGEYLGTDGTFVTAFSLIGNPGSANITSAGPNVTGVDPQLGPLQSNGGPTQTHAPSFSSPALDAGVANGSATDQRGAPRTFDAANLANAAGGDGTDIGAVELLPGGRLSLASCKGATENLLFAPGTAIVGTDANDVIVGTDANDNINSGKGKDLVCAGGGNDAVKAGSGKDNVAGQAGKDRIKGNGGNDKLQGNAGRDTLKGGGGKDTLKGGGGKDKLRGGPGRDKLKGGGGKDSEVQ